MSSQSEHRDLKFLITQNDPGLAEEIRRVAPQLSVVVVEDEETALCEIADADAMYGYITPQQLAAARRLRWIQVPRAALENILFPELIAHPVVLTNTRGIYADVIADHVMSFILYFARGLHHHICNQRNHRWPPHLELADCYIALCEATLGIVGLGAIGMALVKRAAASEMRIVAIKARPAEKPSEVAELWLPDRFHHLLAQSDFVVNCLPETSETRGLFDEGAFQAMKPGGFLINVGRGKTVQLEPLVAALREGRLAGAGLDVFEVEPLPPDHPLWDMENVIITPHSAAQPTPHVGRRGQVLLENIRRFVADEPLMNVVDKKRRY